MLGVTEIKSNKNRMSSSGPLFIFRINFKEVYYLVSEDGNVSTEHCFQRPAEWSDWKKCFTHCGTAVKLDKEEGNVQVSTLI